MHLACEYCNTEGTEYCDKENVQCICKPNVIGYKCDTCDFGFYGSLPCQGSFLVSQ